MNPVSDGGVRMKRMMMGCLAGWLALLIGVQQQFRGLFVPAWPRFVFVLRDCRAR